jgi:8-amino-7-oxononanoate synthase
MSVELSQAIHSPVSAEIMIGGRRYLNFGGSSYLGLSARQEIIEAGIAPLRAHGSGYQFPREFNIATIPHHEVEMQAAAFFGCEAALYLASGYFFGAVALSASRNRFTTLFFDEWAHHCLRDAIAIAGVASHAFRHLDAEDLARQLRTHLPAAGRPLVITDGMYSTFGEIAPLDALTQVIAPYAGSLLVDESHSFGVLGKSGRGACEHHGIAGDTAIAGGSTCKALGVVGGLILGTAAEIATFRLTPIGRGASIGLPAAAAMCAASLRYLREHPELLARLRTNVARLKTGLRQLGFDAGDSMAPVAAFVPAGGRSVQDLQQRLMAEGILVLHSTYIGAGRGGVIRCGIFADHTHQHIDVLLDALRRLA